MIVILYINILLLVNSYGQGYPIIHRRADLSYSNGGKIT